MIVDGRAIAKDLLSTVRKEMATLGKEPVVRAVSMQPNAATESYLRIKAARATDAGMRFEHVRAEAGATTEELIEKVRAPGADAVIVQLPLPSSIDAKAVCDAIPRTHDADVLSADAYEQFKSGAADALLPPVVAAVQAVLERENVNPQGERIVIIGRGRLVGEPSALWLSRFSPVDVITKDAADFSLLKEADIVVCGAGQAGLVQPEMLKAGVVLIDAGTSESEGAMKGDADPACAEVASVFTPVPGGMGPVAVACLFKNVASLVRSGADLA